MTGGHRLDLAPEHFPAARTLLTRLARDFGLEQDRPLVIGISGESGSGKSITAGCLAIELERAGLPTRVLHQDDYFRLPPRANHEQRCRDLAHVGPHEVDLDLMRRHIAAFRAGATRVQAPRVDYPTDSFLTQTYDFAGVRVLIAEGTYVLTFDDLDVRVFLTATHEATRERRRTRNRDIDAPVIEQVLAIEHRIIAPLAERADILIDESFAVHGAGRAGDRRQEHPGVTDRRAHHE